MSELALSGLQFACDGSTLEVSVIRRPDMRFTLDAQDVDQLIGFLVSSTYSGPNRRLLFRVPLWKDSGLRVVLHGENQSAAAVATNISFTGMQVDLLPEDRLEIPIGTEIDVDLEFEGSSQRRRAIVCRSTRRGYGLRFPETFQAEEIDPPPALAELVMQLQRRWSARRKSLR